MLKIRGNFSWGFTAKEDSDGAKKKPAGPPGGSKSKKPEDKKSEASDEKKMLSKFITLKDVDLEFQRGEFVCIIGDVGSGKSSLLNAIIGDLIYVSDEQITR